MIILGKIDRTWYTATRYEFGSDVSRWTLALDHVVEDSALGVDVARVRHARTFASFVYAGLVRRTLGVLAASNYGSTETSRVTGEAWWTLAYCLVVYAVALGVLAALAQGW